MTRKELTDRAVDLSLDVLEEIRKTIPEFPHPSVPVAAYDDPLCRAHGLLISLVTVLMDAEKVDA